MPSEIIIAAAGGGKTTRIVQRSLADPSRRVALVTYTNNNVGELHKRFYELGPVIPANVEIWSWYRFLLHEMVRPYQSVLLSRRIENVQFVDGRSALYARKSEIEKYYLCDDGRLVYSDKISELILALNIATKGAIIARLKLRFVTVFVDEVQDMAGYDLDLLELLLRSGLDIVLVGDHRQATFSTNNSPKNKAFAGPKIIEKLRAWEKAKLADLIFERETHRCHQSVADLADAFFPDEPTTISRRTTVTGHDGVFLIRRADVSNYVERHDPQVLRLSRSTKCDDLAAMNFGDSKGLTFSRVLIFPHKKGEKWLKTGNFSHVEASATKLYVGITRAQHSVAFVFDGDSALKQAVRYNER